MAIRKETITETTETQVKRSLVPLLLAGAILIAVLAVVALRSEPKPHPVPYTGSSSLTVTSADGSVGQQAGGVTQAPGGSLGPTGNPQQAGGANLEPSVAPSDTTSL